MPNIRIGDQVCSYFRVPGTGWKWVRTGPYRVVEIHRGCTCPQYHDFLSRGDSARPRRSHIHLECRLWETPEGQSDGPFYLSGYDEYLDDVLYGPNDIVVIGERGPEPQMELFDIRHIEETDG